LAGAVVEVGCGTRFCIWQHTFCKLPCF